MSHAKVTNVCVLRCAYPHDGVENASCVGWRAQVRGKCTSARGKQQWVQVFGQWLKLNAEYLTGVTPDGEEEDDEEEEESEEEEDDDSEESDSSD